MSGSQMISATYITQLYFLIIVAVKGYETWLVFAEEHFS